eukprot:6922572-Ditylum_brightwellii.AAC.2
MRLEVCRSQAMRMMKNGIKDYIQWFPNKSNDVSDALSRNNDWDDDKLTHILKTFAPSQRLPVKEQLQEKYMRTSLGRGKDGRNMPPPLELIRTSSLTASPGDPGSKP